MFVSNRTRLECTLARGRLTDELGALSLNVELSYSVGDGGELEAIDAMERAPTDPPDIRRIVLWRDTSVTAAGAVHGPRTPPYARPLCLRVDAQEHRLVAFGPRRWVGALASALRPSGPEPFEQLVLGWQHAFGGSYQLAPGLCPGTDLPHPGGLISYPLNATGVGLYRDEQAALDQPLPQIELAGALVERSTDRPRPGGVTPCPELAGMRLEPGFVAAVSAVAARSGQSGAPPSEPTPSAPGAPPLLRQAMRLQHHAPGELVYPWLPPGTMLALEGVGTRPLALRLPGPPVRVAARRGRHHAMELEPRLRSAHLDGDQRRLRVTYGFAQHYSPWVAPSWIEVSAAGVGS
jgi:hypothetical protein